MAHGNPPTPSLVDQLTELWPLVDQLAAALRAVRGLRTELANYATTAAKINTARGETLKRLATANQAVEAAFRAIQEVFPQAELTLPDPLTDPQTDPVKEPV